MKGKISISRINSNDPSYHNMIHIKIEDEDYKNIVDVTMAPEQFGLALTGLSCQECEIEERGIKNEN